MATPIPIRLSRLQWERLESHLPEGICEELTDDEPSDPIEDCRMVANEATYRAILAIANVHCPDLVQAIEKEKHKWDIASLTAQSPVAVPTLPETRGRAELHGPASSTRGHDRSRVRTPVILVLVFVLVELCYLAFFARCMPLLTGRGQCQRPSLDSQPGVIASPDVSWSTFFNTAGFLFDIFGVYCLLFGGAVWRETLERPRSLRPFWMKPSGKPEGSVETLSVWGVILLMMGLLLHVVSLFL